MGRPGEYSAGPQVWYLPLPGPGLLLRPLLSPNSGCDLAEAPPSRVFKVSYPPGPLPSLWAISLHPWPLSALD